MSAPSLRGATQAPSAETAPIEEDPLSRFHEALEGLGKAKGTHARVAVFGDSHTQAGFWTDALRRALALRFGDGGPGFFHVALPGFRHPDARVEATGFRVSPSAPSLPTPEGSGEALGLGGVIARGGTDARILVTSAASKLHWEVCLRGGERAMRANVADVEIVVPPKGTVHVPLDTSSASSHTARISLASDDGALCGAVVEVPDGGVVVDALGINGARYATFLGWSSDAFPMELRRRDYDLVIFEYGTNETSDDPLRTDLIENYLTLAREVVGSALPRASCLVLGATPRLDREGAADALDLALGPRARSIGCAFLSLSRIIGGTEGMRRWKVASPALAQDDGIHLTMLGYARLGEEVAELLTRGLR